MSLQMLQYCFFSLITLLRNALLYFFSPEAFALVSLLFLAISTICADSSFSLLFLSFWLLSYSSRTYTISFHSCFVSLSMRFGNSKQFLMFFSKMVDTCSRSYWGYWLILFFCFSLKWGFSINSLLFNTLISTNSTSICLGKCQNTSTLINIFKEKRLIFHSTLKYVPQMSVFKSLHVESKSY